MTNQSQSPLTPVVFHILLALSDGPAHGYAIMKRVEEESGMKMGPGTVYGSLARLCDSGWVNEVDPRSSDQRRGKDFRLTRTGKAALREEARRITRLARLQQVRNLTPEPSA